MARGVLVRAERKSILSVTVFLLSSFYFVFIFFLLVMFVLSGCALRCLGICEFSFCHICFYFISNIHLHALPDCTVFSGHFQLTEIAYFIWKNRRLSKHWDEFGPVISLWWTECKKWRLLRRKYWKTGNPLQKWPDLILHTFGWNIGMRTLYTSKTEY